MAENVKMITLGLFLLLPVFVSGATVTVDFRGGYDYEDISSAIIASPSNTTIILEDGTYRDCFCWGRYFAEKSKL